MSEHEVVYTNPNGLEVVCSCGSALSIYGLTRTIASVFGEHIRNSITARHDADIAAAKAAGAAEVIARVEAAVEAWNIEVARLSRVRAKAEAMVSDYTHAEAGHVRMAGRTILHILDTPVPDLRAALTTGGEG